MFRAARLSAIFAASALGVVAQETPPPIPAEEAEVPAAVPVPELPPLPAAGAADVPAAIPVEEEPEVRRVEPGGNIPRPPAMESAISRSGMFRVHGGEASQRSSVALLLEQTKDRFEQLLVDRELKPEEKHAGPVPELKKPKTEDFKVTVDVMLAGKPGDPPPPRRVAYEVIIAPHAFFLRIHIHMARGIDNELLERAAFTILLYERALRGVTPETLEDDPVVRPWLVEGLIEADKWRSNRADRRIYEAVFRQGGGFTLDEIFELPDSNFKRLDGASKLSFRALSGALVMALLEQPEGRSAFRAFCGEAALFSGEMPVLLRKHFPKLNLSGNSLAKWWNLKLAQIVQPQLTEVLSVLKTEEGLNEALQFHLRDAKENPVKQGIEAWPAIVALKDAERAEAVRPAEDALVRLSYRCFPSYRPILVEYQRLLREIAIGKKGGDPGKMVAELAEQRKLRLERGIRARDYMDFIEISQARQLSGEFEDYMRLKEELKLRPRPPRHDWITEVLDYMDKKVYTPRPKR